MNIPDYETLKIQVDGPIGRLILNRPERMNALSHNMLEELQEAANWIDNVASIKVVVLAGEGKHFCRGADVGGQINMNLSEREMLDLGRKMTDRVANMRPIVIGKLHGYVIGGGFVLALACDIRICANNVAMCLPEAILGWPVPWGCVPRLVREVGPQAAKEIILACPTLNGNDAFQLGLVRRTVPVNKLDEAISDLVNEIVKRPAVVIDIIKRTVNEAADDMAATSRGKNDIDRMMVALKDEEALRATQEGIINLVERFKLRDQAPPEGLDSILEDPRRTK